MEQVEGTVASSRLKQPNEARDELKSFEWPENSQANMIR